MEREEFDVVVIGSGAAGMTAALTAAHHQLSVVVLEKAGWFGGSAARSGGGVWIPANSALPFADSPEHALTYLTALAGDGPRQRAFLEARPRYDRLRHCTHPAALSLGTRISRLLS